MCGTEYGFLSRTILCRRDLLTAYDGHSISYDAIGNPTTWYDGAAMTWTNGRRLATISATNDQAALSFTYNSDGLRLTKTAGCVRQWGGDPNHTRASVLFPGKGLDRRGSFAGGRYPCTS